MRKTIFCILLLFPLLLSAQATYGNLSPMYVDGSHLKDVHGNIIRLHGVSDSPEPVRNHNRWGEEAVDANISKCSTYFSKIFTGITSAKDGTSCNAFRLILEPAWTVDAALVADGQPAYKAFSAESMKTHAKSLYWKMILNALRKGLYVVVSAPADCPEKVTVGDDYNQYLANMWDAFTKNDSVLKYSGLISLELAQQVGAVSPKAGGDEATARHDFFQPIVDKIRANGFGGILWTPAGEGTCRAEGKADGPQLKTVPAWQAGLKEEMAGDEGLSLMLASADAYLDLDSLDASGSVVPAATDGTKDCWDCFAQLSEQYPSFRPYKHYYTADQGNGTFINPILNGDFPDIDIIRVDDNYYLMSTTMYIFPGATIMKSKDLVNWEYCCNPLEKIDDNDAYNLLNGKEHYAQGQWATSMRYHDGQFYVYFISYGRNGVDSGRNVLLTAKNAEGPWKMQYMNEHYYDSGWLFDDGPNGDGYLYVACGITGISVNKLDAKTLKKISSTQVLTRESTEGARMYHIGKYYYLYLTTGGYWRGQTIYRSEKPMGPYEEMPNLNNYSNVQGGNAFWGYGIHQGGLVETQTGEWWTIMFKDAGGIGRVPYLEPVVWKDGWPIIGNGGKEVSQGSKAYRKPDVGTTHPRTYLPTSDSFTSLTLGKQWGWNHNHVDDKWSLLERPGYLRLHTVNVTTDLRFARNSLTQRIMGLNTEGSSRNTNSYGTIKMDVSAMQEGDVAGLSVFQDPYSLIGVTMRDGQKHIVYMKASTDSDPDWVVSEKLGPVLKSDTVYLRAIVNLSTNKSDLYYSYNNSTWTKFGDQMSLRFNLSVFVGNRFYIFNYATKQTGGYVDIDWFSTEDKFSEDFFYGDALLHNYPAEEVTAVSLKSDKASVMMLPGAVGNVKLTCTMESGQKVDVSTGCTYTFSNPNVLTVKGNKLVGQAEGSTEVTATYVDPLGNSVSTTFTVEVTYFPLTEGALNPALVGAGTMVVSKNYTTLRAQTNGIAGWHYDQGLDLTDKGQYLVVRKGRALTTKPVIRIYDTNDLSSSSYYESESFGGDTISVIDLKEAAKVVDLSHVYYVAVYTPKATNIQLVHVFLSDDGINPTAIQTVVEEPRAELVKVEFITLDGRSFDTLQKGVNVVRKTYSDGHTEAIKVTKR